MKANEIATKAAELVSGDRESQHGDKAINGQCMAYMLEAVEKCRALTGHAYDAEHGFNCMESIKIARRYSGQKNPDDYIDGAGYSSCAGEVATEPTEPTGWGG